MDLRELSGFEMLQRIMEGKLPPPSMAATMQMALVRVEKGLAVFQARAGRQHLNPMGGGMAVLPPRSWTRPPAAPSTARWGRETATARWISTSRC